MAQPTTSSAFLSRLKVRHLQLILQLAGQVSLRQAAENMRISQPSASALLQEAEAMFGVLLCERSARGLRLNAFGRIVAQSAQTVLNDIERMHREIVQFNAGIVGSISIGAVMASLSDIVAPTLAAIATTHPGIVTSLEVDTSDNLLPDLRSGRFDIMIGRPLGALLDKDLVCQAPNSEPLCVIASRDHPLAAREVLALPDLGGVDWVLQAPPSPMRRAVDTAFVAQGIPPPRARIETASFHATIQIVEGSLLCGIVPVSVGELLRRNAALALLPVQITNLIGDYYIITSKERSLGPAAALVHAALVARAIGKPDH